MTADDGVRPEDREEYEAARRRTFAYQGEQLAAALADLGRNLAAPLVELLGAIRHPSRLRGLDWAEGIRVAVIAIGIEVEVVLVLGLLSGWWS